MNILSPELIRLRVRFYEAVYERLIRLCISERQSFNKIYQKYSNLSIRTGFYGTNEQAYLQYKKFKREVSKILRNNNYASKFTNIKDIKNAIL